MRALLAGAAALVALLVLASPASAAFVALSDNGGFPSVDYYADPGETNNVNETYADGVLTLVDSGVAAIVDGDGPGGCTTAANVATCPTLELNSVSAYLDDMSDAFATDIPAFVNASGGTGADDLRGGPLTGDFLSGGEGADTVDGREGGDFLVGEDGDDVVIGAEGDDTLLGGLGNDTLQGGVGGDFLLGDLGADDQQGGFGSDTADFSGHATGVMVTVDDVADDGAPGEGDNVHSDVESFSGGSGADTLLGDGQENFIFGGPGSDSISGGGGNDSLNGGPGGDVVNGDGGQDGVFGSDENDILDGGDGNDNVDGGLGGDDLRGGPGRDTTSYSHDTTGAIVTLDDQPGDGHPDENDNAHSDLEDMSGSAGNDTLIGNAAANQFSGFDGDDTLIGLGGNDAMSGGDGNDSLAGGDGDDSLSPGTGADASSGGKGVDVVNMSGSEPIRVSLNGEPDDGLEGEGDNLMPDVENFGGGSNDDVLIGDGDANEIFGGGGDDRIVGGGGGDSLFGSVGNDRITGGDGRDALDGESGDDKLNASDKRADRASCGTGEDQVTTRTGGPRDQIEADCEHVKQKAG